MRNSERVAAYQYQADLFCPACIREVIMEGDLAGDVRPVGFLTIGEDALDSFAADLGVDRSNESSFDSDYFPKVVYGDQLSELNVSRAMDYAASHGAEDGVAMDEDSRQRCGYCERVIA